MPGNECHAGLLQERGSHSTGYRLQWLASYRRHGHQGCRGNIFIKGRCKNMLLTASGQNIYPEEIEARLNNMPFVNESLVILAGDKLIALVYPDNEEAFAQGMDKKSAGSSHRGQPYRA